MALQNFVDKVGPVVSAAWLNAVDILKETIFGSATTKAQARTALTLDAPLEVINGGTGVRTIEDLSGSLIDLIQAGFYDVTAAETAAGVTPVDYGYPPGNVIRYGAVGDGTTNDGPAIEAAIKVANAGGPSVFFPGATGYAVKATYTITLVRNLIINANGQRLIFTNGQIRLQGATIRTTTLSASPARYATSITVANATDVVRGDIFFVDTTIAPSSDWVDSKKDTVRISAVSGNILTLDAGLNFAYTTGDSGLSVTIYRPYSFTLLDAQLEMVAADSDPNAYQMFFLRGLTNIRIVRPSIKGQLPFDRMMNNLRTGIWVERCWGMVIESPYYEAMSYPVGIYGASRNVMEFGVSARYTHHAHADVGGYSSDYRLIGLHSVDAWQGLNTHICFRAYADGFHCTGDTGLWNWRCIGGGVSNGYIETSHGDVELPQFTSNTMQAAYEYVYDDADFYGINIEINAPNRSTLVAYGPRYGRMCYTAGIKCYYAGGMVVGFNDDEFAKAIFGPGNELGAAKAPAPAPSSIRSTTVRYDFPVREYEVVASAATLVLPTQYDVVAITGTVSITAITPTGHTGHKVTLVFADVLTVTDGGGLALAGNFTTSSGDTLTLVCDGTYWYEISRSAN